MRIISRSTLRTFIDRLSDGADHRAVEAAVEAWITEVSRGKWTSSADVKALYRHASIVSADRVVFNIKGNDYRLVTSINYVRGIVYIKWIGTHREYSRLNVLEVQHEP